MPPSEAPALTPRRILTLWWPLALSWLLMGVELPLFTACVARMPDPKVNLAAYGSLVFPIALVIEAPIMMLLAAATALASDAESWGRVRRFMHKAGACLTALHVVLAFTPLFDLLARDGRVDRHAVENRRLDVPPTGLLENARSAGRDHGTVGHSARDVVEHLPP